MSKFLALSSAILLVIYFTLPLFLHQANRLLISLATDNNPDYLATTCELAKSRGYDCETHSITTEDGYIIDTQRVSNKTVTATHQTSQGVALLMHGFECDSTIWVQNFQNQSLAYILADENIDVWLGNIRGNFYGERHVKFSSASDPDFWDFSFQEMAQFDLPATVNYILETTGYEKIYYVGHSQGTLMAFLQMSEDETLQDKIEFAFMLTPVYTLTSMITPIRYALDLVYQLGFYIGPYVPSMRLGPAPPLDFVIWSYMYPLPSYYVTEFIWQAFSGDSDHALHRNHSQMVAYFAHGLAGTSVHNVRHFAQIYKEQKLAKFNYQNDKLNLLHYNSTQPPEYNIGKINRKVTKENSHIDRNRTKFALFWGDRDWMVTKHDRMKLQSILGDVIVYSKICENFSHLDFIWGLRANECAYFKISDMVRSHRRQKITSQSKPDISATN
ncbi:lysosomal acid lipase/cholesteryl ester hydrolase-like [Symsagittifera roscoffensis]|uniref:lysosomal acid lipase/cholesteryl ester hydrolase-like n=1 Tax=Symsagittifera roscoffensis TaxID=84072 RepID=UPI00307B9D35